MRNRCYRCNRKRHKLIKCDVCKAKFCVFCQVDHCIEEDEAYFEWYAKDQVIMKTISHNFSLEGEALLEVLDSIGSSWIREVLNEL